VQGGKDDAQKIWPIAGGERKAVEPISQERREAIFKRFNIKRNGNGS